MRWILFLFVIAAAACFGFLLWPRSGAVTIPAGVASGNPGMVERGAYLVAIAGCVSCHWDHKNGGAPFAGGRALASPFGIFYAPNITPDRATGIGDMTDAQFVDALLHGVGRAGENLYPAFPFTSYRRMTVEDALAIKAWLFTLAPISRTSTPHDIGFPFSWRPLLSGWRLLFFDGPIAETEKTAMTRGAYLVEALGHCSECHTPRNRVGALDISRWLAGSKIAGGVAGGVADGVSGGVSGPNITMHDNGIGAWARDDIMTFLKTGLTPEFDVVQGEMAEVIENGTKHLTDDDLGAIADYLLATTPLPDRAAP